jgi:hypothetical protein
MAKPSGDHIPLGGFVSSALGAVLLRLEFAQ